MGAAGGKIAACTAFPTAGCGEPCFCRARAFVRNKPPRVKSDMATSDVNQWDLLIRKRFFMGGFSVRDILDSELGKATDAEPGNPLHYNLVMFFGPGLGL